MLLEVNNTFGERRIYLLVPPGMGSSDQDIPATASESNECHELKVESDYPPSSPARMPTKFHSRWLKDFHVSPFNSRKGSYSLVACDPLLPNLNGRGPIDNTITLNSSESHPKLVARIVSTGPAIDPETLHGWSSARFLLSWWWVGFCTFPRILKEAAALFFRKRLAVWYRPEVSKASISRHETELERFESLIFPSRHTQLNYQQDPRVLLPDISERAGEASRSRHRCEILWSPEPVPV